MKLEEALPYVRMGAKLKMAVLDLGDGSTLIPVPTAEGGKWHLSLDDLLSEAWAVQAVEYTWADAQKLLQAGHAIRRMSKPSILYCMEGDYEGGKLVSVKINESNGKPGSPYRTSLLGKMLNATDWTAVPHPFPDRYVPNAKHQDDEDEDEDEDDDDEV